MMLTIEWQTELTQNIYGNKDSDVIPTRLINLIYCLEHSVGTYKSQTLKTNNPYNLALYFAQTHVQKIASDSIF